MSGLDGYRAFLAARDGEPDVARHVLPAREALFARLAREPVRSGVPIDAAAYRRNVARRRPEPGLEPRLLWVLATAKANQAERFGVGLGELYGRIPYDGDPLPMHVALQEHYHTRILADVVAMFGVAVRPTPPPFFTRAVIHVILGVPERWHRPLTGCFEMIGCVVFRMLRDAGVALFADEPAVCARIHLLYDEILGDEIGHVGMLAAQLGPAGRALARRLYRLLGGAMARQFPELVTLVGRAELARRLGAFHLHEMADELPGRAYAAETI